MNHKLLILDIDGTLRPLSQPKIPEENRRAIQSLQACGVKIAIATGRGRGAVPAQTMNGLVPDYWICCAGAQVLDRDGQQLWSSRMSFPVLARIIPFFRERDYPFFLCREDGNCLFSGYEKYLLLKDQFPMIPDAPYDPDPTHLYRNLPFSCLAWMPQEAEGLFHESFPEAPVSFYFYRGKFCDIMQAGITKATGLDRLLALTGIDLSDTVFIGDGENDIPLLQHAAMSYAVADGKPLAKQAAKQICPPAEECGVAAVCRALWPEAFCQEAGVQLQTSGEAQ